MTSAVKTLQRVLVNYFYKVNAALFTFIFFVLFGAPYSPVAFHLSLITGIIQSQVFLLCVMLIWILYNFKCIDYILKQLKNPRQSFLFCLNCLSNPSLYMHMFFVHVLVYMPVLLYSLVIVLVAFKQKNYLPAFEIILFNLLILITTPLAFIKGIQQNLVPINLNWRINFVFKKPFFVLPLYFLFDARKQMLLLTKVFSLLVLHLFLTLYEPEGYDLRPLQLCLLVIAASHSTIVFEIRSFEKEFLEFGKNLPLTTTRRFVRTIGMFCLLLLPEFILLLKGLQIHFVIKDYPQLLLLMIALVCLFYVVLLLEDINTEQFLRIVFGIMAGCFFIILYNPGIFLSIAVITLAYALYNSYYYNYEEKMR